MKKKEVVDYYETEIPLKLFGEENIYKIYTYIYKVTRKHWFFGWKTEEKYKAECKYSLIPAPFYEAEYVINRIIVQKAKEIELGAAAKYLKEKGIKCNS